MTHTTKIAGLAALAVLFAGWFVYAQNEQRSTEQPAKDKNSEMQEIKSNTTKFVAAYNSHDAKAIAALFADDAEFEDESGARLQGRASIEKSFAEFFSENPAAKIEITPTSVRLLAPTLALEDGSLCSHPTPDSGECGCKYAATYARVGNNWLIAALRDFPNDSDDHESRDDDDDDPAAGDRLQELAWMIGSWVDESPDAIVRSVVRWDDNDNFILNDFHAYIGGEIALRGQMRIGWDPLTKRFKAWVFDSGGGYSEGLWVRDEDKWVIKWQGATSDGEAASSTSVYRLINDDTIAWRSTDRVIDGELTEEVDEILVKRQPPLPGE